MKRQKMMGDVDAVPPVDLPLVVEDCCSHFLFSLDEPKDFETGRYQCYRQLADLIGRLMSGYVVDDVTAEEWGEDWKALLPSVILHVDSVVLQCLVEMHLNMRSNPDEALRMAACVLVDIRAALTGDGYGNTWRDVCRLFFTDAERLMAEEVEKGGM